jgi:hypothetical protein
VTRETLNFETQDEAIAEALRGSAPGDFVEVHSKDCKGREEQRPPYDVIGCTCTPMLLRAGATS